MVEDMAGDITEDMADDMADSAERGVLGVTRMLSPRLMAVADGIVRLGRQDLIYDIGTDHALLPIYLTGAGICDSVEASDISPKSIERAKRNAAAAGASDKIHFFTGDGFMSFPDFQDGKIIIIAGIGGKNLTEIIERGHGRPCRASALILQPMSGQETLREWMFNNSYDIPYERLAREGNRIYSLLFCRYTGAPIRYTQTEKFLGKRVEYENENDYAHFLRFTRLKAMNRYAGLTKMSENGNMQEVTETNGFGEMAVSLGGNKFDYEERENLKIVIDEIDRQLNLL